MDEQQVVLITNKIEGHRLLHEELDGLQSEIQVFYTLPSYYFANLLM